ncbi:hypothetical protein, partial [Aneurinibacillus migulanus]
KDEAGRKRHVSLFSAEAQGASDLFFFEPPTASDTTIYAVVVQVYPGLFLYRLLCIFCHNKSCVISRNQQDGCIPFIV